MRNHLKPIILILLGMALQCSPFERLCAKEKVQKAAPPVNLIWPLPPDKPRVKFLEMFSNNFDIEPRKKITWVDRMVGNGDPNVVEAFKRPAGVGADSKGRIFIASTENATVYILDKGKHTVARLRGDQGFAFKTPVGLVVDAQDNLYVADATLHSVMKFDPDGHIRATLGNDAGLKNPTFLALDEPRRRLFVVDSHLHQVFVFNLDTLRLEAKVGKRGEKNGEFNYPVGVGVGPDGSFAVTDTGSCSVQVFSRDLKFVRRFGRQGYHPGEFVRPKGVAYDREGNIWVVDAAFNNFQIFTPDGHILMFVGSKGSSPGQFDLPMGISIDSRNRVYVSDSLNSRVQVFQFLGGN
jgi:DNA-binding beta-propeller fold protein YncE